MKIVTVNHDAEASKKLDPPEPVLAFLLAAFGWFGKISLS